MNRPGALRQTLVLAAFVAACLAIGALGSMATSSSVGTWYQTLAKPSFNPPDWVFAPVWTTLYILMGVAGWLVWRASGWAKATPALAMFAVQLVLNLAWSFLFFGSRQIGLALIEIVLLLAAIVATALLFRRHSSWAAILLMPYAAWVSFATVLNATLWRLN